MLHVQKICVALGLVTLVPASCTGERAALADTEPPARGLAMDARLTMPIAGGSWTALGIFGGGVAGVPPVSLGYRGRGFGIFVGPHFNRRATEGALFGAGTTSPGEAIYSSSVSRYGVSALGEATLLESSDRRTDFHGLFGVTVAGNAVSTDITPQTYGALGAVGPFGGEGVSGHASFGFGAGIGVRHWLTPHLGLGAEIGESYMNDPLGVADGRSLRGSSFATFGALDLAVTL